MRMNITYTNGTPPFSKSVKKVKGWDTPIVELKIEGAGGRSKKAALNDYIVTLTYAFRDLINKHETDIDKLDLDECVIGSIHKSQNDITFINKSGDMDSISKYDMILFTLYRDSFNEQLYFTRNEDILTEGGIMFAGNQVNSPLLDKPKGVNRRFTDSLLSAISVNLANYSIEVNEATKKLEYTYKGKVINSIDEIKEDDVFVFFKLVEVLIGRGKHMGVFFLDCEFLSVGVLKALLAFIHLYYLQNRMIFLYNMPADKKAQLKNLPYKTIVLPNHKLGKNNNTENK